MKDLNKEMLEFINCVLAHSKPYSEAVAILEENGAADVDILKIEDYYEFLEVKGEQLKTKLEPLEDKYKLTVVYDKDEPAFKDNIENFDDITINENGNYEMSDIFASELEAQMNCSHIKNAGFVVTMNDKTFDVIPLDVKVEKVSTSEEKSFKLDYKGNKYNHSTLDGEQITEVIVNGYDSIEEIDEILSKRYDSVDIVIKSKNSELVIESNLNDITQSVTSLLTANQNDSRLELQK